MADWKYTIPNNPANLSAGYHPVLFVSADSGVYMSHQQWPVVVCRIRIPAFGAVVAGGLFTSRQRQQPGLIAGQHRHQHRYAESGRSLRSEPSRSTPDPDLLMASTFGQGAFAINMGPMVFPSTVQLDASSNSGTAPDGTTLVTISQPIFNGLSSITGFKNATRITIVDETPADPTFGQGHRRV